MPTSRSAKVQLGNFSIDEQDNPTADQYPSHDELLKLWNQPMRLFHLANIMREKSCKDMVSFVVNRNINFTSKCVGSCKFCAFKRSDGYTLSDEDILERVAAAELLGATEICIQGGLAPNLVVEDYCRMLEIIQRDFPTLHLHAFSPMEVVHMARNSDVAPEDAIIELKKSGLGSMPGTAAEILADEVRKEICPQKLSSDEWRQIITTSHGLGIPTSSTMLYGHIETLHDRLRHMEILRQIQAETNGFTEFVLLPFMPGNNELGRLAPTISILEHMKMHALARVALYPFINNIQASWVKLGRESASALLEWGVNDLGGTLMEENISRSAGGTESQYISADELKELIEKSGRRPMQRTTLYEHMD